MRQIISSILGENPNSAYDEHKYSKKPFSAVDAGIAAKAIGERKEELVPRIYGAESSPSPPQENDKNADALGCWLLDTPQVDKTGASRQLALETSLPRSETVIAAGNPPTARGNTSAAFTEESYKTPFDRAQELVQTGTLTNTYTQEVSAVFENDLPGPNRKGVTKDSVEREKKAMQLRLHNAHGKPRSAQPKKELENPMPAADAGQVTMEKTNQTHMDTRSELQERHSRDAYFNRHGITPTEKPHPEGPAYHYGYQNLVRPIPYLEHTNQLETHGRTTNAEEYPTTEGVQRPNMRLHVDAQPGRLGVAEASLPEYRGVTSQVRVDETQRNEEGEVAYPNIEQEIYGANLPQNQTLRTGDKIISSPPPIHIDGQNGMVCLTTESILSTLPGFSDSDRIMDTRPPAVASNAMTAEGTLKHEKYNDSGSRVGNAPAGQASFSATANIRSTKDAVGTVDTTRALQTPNIQGTTFTSEVKSKNEGHKTFAHRRTVVSSANAQNAHVGESFKSPEWLMTSNPRPTNNERADAAFASEHHFRSMPRKGTAGTKNAGNTVPSWLAPTANIGSLDMKTHVESCPVLSRGGQGPLAQVAETSTMEAQQEILAPPVQRAAPSIDAQSAKVAKSRLSNQMPIVERVQGAHANVGRRKEIDITFANSERGQYDVYRAGHDKVGGDCLEVPSMRFNPGARHWRAELVISPEAAYSLGNLYMADRATIGRTATPNKRELKIARSPKPGVKARSGLANRLTDAPITRSEA